MLRLRDINFGTIFCATGTLGFYKEGYPFHRFYPWKPAIEMLRDRAGFSGKTVTLLPRRGKTFNEPGNMEIRPDGVTPKEFAPKCIWVGFRNGGEMINAVGLTNFGAEYYLKTGNYHKIGKPFFISIYLQGETASDRKEELRQLCRLIRRFPFRVPFAIQINVGCPNSGHDITAFYGEICELVEIAKEELPDTPIVVNCNALMPTAVLVEVSRIADGLWIGNTIPFNDPATIKEIKWSRFGSESPLRRRGINADGGLSSHDCLEFTVRKVQELRWKKVRKPIIGGNGIRTAKDIERLRHAGCNAAFVGSLAVVRPWRVKEILDAAHHHFGHNSNKEKY